LPHRVTSAFGSVPADRRLQTIVGFGVTRGFARQIKSKLAIWRDIAKSAGIVAE
jgi:hypothetical protein